MGTIGIDLTIRAMTGRAPDQYSKQEAAPSRARLCAQIAERGRNLPLVAAIALLPALLGCSSSSDEYTAAASAYPSQSLADLFKGSQSSAPPPQPAPAARPAGAPILSDSSTPVAAAAMAGQPNPAASGSAPAAALPASAAPPPADEHSAASVYPSQSLFSLFKNSRTSPPPAQPAGSQVSSGSSPAGANTAVTSQPNLAAPSASMPAAGAIPLAAAPSDADDHSAASVYPSVSLMDLLSGANKPPQQ